MYYPVNNFGNCFIFNKSLSQDLENYSLEWSGEDLHILYANEKIAPDNKINFKIDKLVNLIPTPNDDTINVWQPLLLNDTSSVVSYMPVLKKTLNENPILGIDQIISFTPKFKNWDIEEVAGDKSSMIVNWHTNSILGPSIAPYGVLCWYKYSDYVTSSGIAYSELPKGTKFNLDSALLYKVADTTYSIDAKTLLVKFDDDNIKLLNTNNAIIKSNSNVNDRSNPIDFNIEKKLLNISSIINKDNLNYCKLIKDSGLIINGKSVDLFISDGECFSYYYGLADKLRINNKQMCSRTYLSPKLHKIYREIYHRLTLHKKTLNSNFEATMSVKQTRLLQKLCYYLSSGPLMDRTTIDFLSDKLIYDKVQTYISETVTDIDREKTLLQDIIKEIYKKYQKLSTYNYKTTILSNYISNKKDLFKCLINKYSCSLWINGHTKLKYKTPLANGPHACISTQTFNWRSKSLQPTQISYNNSYIKIGNISYSTDFSDTKSIIKVTADNLTSGIEIPLADISLTKKRASPLYMGTGIYKPNTELNSNDEIVFDLNGFDFMGSSTDRQVFYSFEQVSGPHCLRFDNLAKSKFGRYKSATTQNESPTIYVRQSGTYEVKCTRSNYGRVESDILTLTTDSNYSDNLINISRDITDYPKLITSTIKSIAFNKRGLIWIIDSDNYMDTKSFLDFDDIDQEGILIAKDLKFDIDSSLNNPNEKLTILQNDASLTIGFNASQGDCPLSINTITIENMRDNDYKYCQCRSFYQEKIKRKRRKVSFEEIPSFGASDFYRELSKEYDLAYHNIDGRVIGANNTSVSLRSTSQVSTSYSPPILAYGGYTKNITDTIGIALPSHPSPRPSGALMPISGIDNYKLPIISDRFNGLQNDGNNPIYCYLKEIRPSGDKHFVTFSKGHFHPISGWIDNDTQLNGKSNVVLSQAELKNSYKFDGIGFSSLKGLLNKDISNTYKSSIILSTKTDWDYDFEKRYGYVNRNFNAKLNPNYFIEDVQDGWRDDFNCGDAKITYFVSSGVSQKTIESLEVKLKFLNHINPKNLIISLSAENSNNNIISNYSFIDSDNISNITQGNLKDYLTNTTGINTTGINISGITKYDTVLLFGEHLDNYCPHFSLQFADTADKYTVSHNASYLNSNPGFEQKTVGNNGTINVAVGTVDKTQKDITTYNYIIKMNQLNQSNNILNKLRGIPLSGTVFTLKVRNIEPIEYDDTIMDNLNNNIFINSDNSNYSNILNNNLCSWSVIIHTNKTTNSVDSDLLGYIDYSSAISGLVPTGTMLSSLSNTYSSNNYIGSYNPINISGYDFIANFTDKNFLIPLVNINAPYAYLSNISQCFYDDPDIATAISTLPPTFPSLLGYQLAISTALTLSFGGTVGALAGLETLNRTLGIGGRADPIAGYLISVRDYNLSMDNNSQIYKPVYSTKSFGYPDRVIVAISQDGAIWYNTEVPIFRYTNTPTLQKNIYKYVKLNTTAPKYLSQFTFKKLSSIEDLNLANCIGNVSTNIDSKNGSQNVEGFNLKDGDIVLLTNQTNTADNGYWKVSDNNWLKIPCVDNCSNTDFLLYNNVDKEFINTIQYSSTIGKNILIDNIRAYNFFDLNETIELSEPSGTRATVVGKSIVSTNNGQKTVLTLDMVAAGDGKIFKPDSYANVIFLYKDDTVPPTGYYRGNEVALNMWNLDSTNSYKIKNQTPSTRISTIGEGSIGWGTNSIFPTPLSSVELSDNRDIFTNNIFNNSNNDHYHLEKLTIIDSNNNITHIDVNHSDDAKDKIKASSYSKEAFGASHNDIKQEYKEDNELNRLFKKLHSFAEYDKKNNSFLELKSDKFISIPNSGLITIEGDYLFNQTIKFSDSDITSLNTRLSGLLSFSNNFDTSSVTDIYQVSSIIDFTKYYNSLPPDSGSCYQPSGNRPTQTLCKKLLAGKRLNELYQEKQDIQMALRVNRYGINKPHISGIVTNHLPTGLLIDYKSNDDLYWIHIDPNQKCIVNDELSVKVLKKIRTKTLPALTDVGGGGVFADNVITLPISTANQLEYNTITINNSNAEIKYNFEGDSEIISIPDNIVQSHKQEINQKYPSLNWGNEDEEFVYGDSPSPFANSKINIISDGIDKDYIIRYTETYIRPTGLLNTRKISEVIDLSNTNEIKLQFRNLTRKIKSIDSEDFERYGYDYNGNLVKDTRSPASVGQIANNFVCWHCVNVSGVHVTGIPPFLIAANEMRYRAFFGSIDGVEHKNTNVSDSLEDWEWIPFEYYTSGNPPPV